MLEANSRTRELGIPESQVDAIVRGVPGRPVSLAATADTKIWIFSVLSLRSWSESNAERIVTTIDTMRISPAYQLASGVRGDGSAEREGSS